MASLAYADMASRHGYRKVKQSHMDDVIDTEMSTFEITLMAVTIGGGVINRDRVITKIVEGCNFEWEF